MLVLIHQAYRKERAQALLTSPANYSKSVKIICRTPKIGVQSDTESVVQQNVCAELASASDWILMHVPETERSLVRMWVGNVELKGATLARFIQPLVQGSVAPLAIAD